MHVATCTQYDWMHLYLEGGLLDLELGLVIKHLHQSTQRRGVTTVSYCTLGEYVGRWKWPKVAPHVEQLFDETANNKNLKNEAFSSSASELLTLAPVLASFFSAIVAPMGICSAAVACIIALLNVVELLATVKRGIVSPRQLLTAILEHLRRFLDVYGRGRWKPKHHYALHLPLMLARFGMLVACFTHERKHRVLKRYMRSRLNNKKFEASCLEDVTIQHLEDLLQEWRYTEESLHESRDIREC